MIDKDEVCSQASRTSRMFSEATIHKPAEGRDASIKPCIEARWVRSREKPDYMYCSHCFKGYYSFKLSDRTLFPLAAHRYFYFCPLCGADMILDAKRADKTPRYEDEMTYDERNAGKELDWKEADEPVIAYYTRKPLHGDFCCSDEDYENSQDEDSLDKDSPDEDGLDKE